MPKIVDREDMQHRILRAAGRAFSRYGYRGSSLQRVAAEARMGKSSLYHYFSTKEALFAGLMNALLRHEVAVFDAAAAGDGSAAERLRTLLDTVLALYDEWAQAGPLLIDCLREAAGRRLLRRTFSHVRAATARLIRQGQRDGAFLPGDPQALAAVVVGCLDGVLLQELLEPGCTRAPAVRRALRETIERAVRRGGSR